MSNLNDPRVLFAAERTLLAWNRTAIALMGFGFLVERFGLFLHVILSRQVEPLHRGISLTIGVAFILLGVILLVVSVRQYRRVVATLGAGEIPGWLLGQRSHVHQLGHCPIWTRTCGLSCLGLNNFAGFSEHFHDWHPALRDPFETVTSCGHLSANRPTTAAPIVSRSAVRITKSVSQPVWLVNADAFHPPPMASTRSTLAAKRRPRRSTAARSFVKAVACTITTLR